MTNRYSIVVLAQERRQAVHLVYLNSSECVPARTKMTFLASAW
jgi:hypothetical protein